MHDRQPVIDAPTWEVLLDVYKIIADADNKNAPIERNDLAYMHAKLEDILKYNSMAEVDPRTNPQHLSGLARLKRVLRKTLP